MPATTKTPAKPAKPKSARPKAKAKRESKPPNLRGRDTKLDKEVQDALVRLISQGSTIRDACAAASIAASTYYVWRQRGEVEPLGIYSDFVQALDQAVAAAKVALISSVHKSGKKQWRAAAWMLSHRYPDEYGALPRDVTIHRADESKRPLKEISDEQLYKDRAATKAALASARAELAAIDAEIAAASASPGPTDSGLGAGGGNGEQGGGATESA
jgi:hypothetical protein